MLVNNCYFVGFGLFVILFILFLCCSRGFYIIELMFVLCFVDCNLSLNIGFVLGVLIRIIGILIIFIKVIKNFSMCFCFFFCLWFKCCILLIINILMVYWLVICFMNESSILVLWCLCLYFLVRLVCRCLLIFWKKFK